MALKNIPTNSTGTWDLGFVRKTGNGLKRAVLSGKGDDSRKSRFNHPPKEASLT
jgi:hypothetical protein